MPVLPVLPVVVPPQLSWAALDESPPTSCCSLHYRGPPLPAYLVPALPAASQLAALLLLLLALGVAVPAHEAERLLAAALGVGLQALEAARPVLWAAPQALEAAPQALWAARLALGVVLQALEAEQVLVEGLQPVVDLVAVDRLALDRPGEVGPAAESAPSPAALDDGFDVSRWW